MFDLTELIEKVNYDIVFQMVKKEKMDQIDPKVFDIARDIHYFIKNENLTTNYRRLYDQLKDLSDKLHSEE